MSIFSQPM